MPYTKTGSRVVEDYLRNKVNIIVEVLKKEIPDTISIIMSGGFGKGEGSVMYKANKVTLINDFDMYIVTKKEHDEEEINEAAQKASKEMGKEGISSFVQFNKNRPLLEEFFYIDLKAIPIDYLKKLPPMVKFFDLRNSSKVIYGPDVLNKIPDLKSENIPLAEGARFLLNRMSHLVQHFYLSFFISKVKENDHQIFLLHTIKTYTDACSALLILAKKYHPSYSDRLKIFKEIYKKEFPELADIIPDYPEKIEEFTNLKLNFDVEAYQKRDLELWKQSRNLIGAATKYFFGKFLNRKIINYYDLSNAIWDSSVRYYNPYVQYLIKQKFKLNIKNRYILAIGSLAAHSYMNFLYFQRMKQYHKKFYLKSLFRLKPPELTFFSALPLILYSLKDDGGVDMDMLEKGKRILKKVYPVNVKNKGDNLKYWEEISLVYSNAYVLFAFLKLK